MKDSTGSAAAVVLEAAMIAGDACGKLQAASAESSEASFVLCAVYLEEVRGQATLAEAEVLTGGKFGAVSLHPRIVQTPRSWKPRVPVAS